MRARASLAILVSLVLAAAPAAAAVAWPDGHIEFVDYCSSYGLRSLELREAGPDTFYFFGVGIAGGTRARPFTYSSTAGAAGGFNNTGNLAWDRAGNLLSLEVWSTMQFQLRGRTFAGISVADAYLAQTSSLTGTVVASCSRDEGGAWFGWTSNNGVRLLKLDPGGAIAPGWQQAGWKLPASATYGMIPFRTHSDGAGGVLALLATDAVRVARVSPDTAYAPGWPAGGLPLENATLTYLSYPEARLIRSDDSHFIATWNGYDTGTYKQVLKCQRFSLSGSLDPNWPVNGLEVGYISGADLIDRLQAVTDGAGGVTLAWQDSNRVQVSHVLADGSFAPGYPGGHRALLDLAPSPVPPIFALATGRPGGACLLYIDSAWGLRGRWVDAAGAPDPSPAFYDAVLLTKEELSAAGAALQGAVQNRLAALADGEGGIFFAWTDPYPYARADDCHASHAAWPGSVLAVPPAAPSALALAAGPNPARGELTARFTLPDARPARLELLDLAGRRVRAVEAGGAGAHRERFADLGALAPGVYLLRLSHDGEVRTARVAVIR